VLLGSTAPAAAHGPAPAALEVVTTSARQPEVVRLNFGLAVWNPDDPEHFRYVCPGRWGEAERVPDIATTPEGALVVPLEDAVWIGDAEGLSFLRAEAPDWRAQTLLGHALGTRTTLVTRDMTGARLWSVDAVTGLVTSEDALPGVTLDSAGAAGPTALWALGARPTPTLWRRDAGGVTSRTLGLEVSPQFLDLRRVDPDDPAHFFFAASVADGVRLYETPDAGGEVVERLRAVRALHGPVPLEDALIALVDGVVWHRPRGASDFVQGEPRPFTCLQDIAGLAIACRDRQLVRLTGPASAPEASPFFSLSQLLGPEAGDECADQWLHFGAEAGLIRADAGAEAEPVDAGVEVEVEVDARVVPAASTGGGEGGCGLVGAGDGAPGRAWLLLLGACLAALRRRTRSNFSKGVRIS
jgi:hypothetical protein